MGITQFISQKMTPTSADPAQAKMMLIMPFVMTIFFMNFQSGLVLYWLTSNVLQIGQQALMNHMIQRKKERIEQWKIQEKSERPPGIQGQEPGGRHPPCRAQAQADPGRVQLRDRHREDPALRHQQGSRHPGLAQGRAVRRRRGIEGFLERLLKVFPLEITYRIQRRNDILFVIFDGPDKQLLLWKDGQLLLALQHVLNKISAEKVQVDCEFYRKRKEKKIREYALAGGPARPPDGPQRDPRADESVRAADRPYRRQPDARASPAKAWATGS